MALILYWLGGISDLVAIKSTGRLFSYNKSTHFTSPVTQLGAIETVKSSNLGSTRQLPKWHPIQLGASLSSSVSGFFGCILNHFWWHSVLLRDRKWYSGRSYTTFGSISKVYAAFDVVFWSIHDHLVATFDTNSLSYCRPWRASANGEAVTDPNGRRLECHNMKYTQRQSELYPPEWVSLGDSCNAVVYENLWGFHVVYTGDHIGGGCYPACGVE